MKTVIFILSAWAGIATASEAQYCFEGHMVKACVYNSLESCEMHLDSASNASSLPRGLVGACVVNKPIPESVDQGSLDANVKSLDRELTNEADRAVLDKPSLALAEVNQHLLDDQKKISAAGSFFLGSLVIPLVTSIAVASMINTQHPNVEVIEWVSGIGGGGYLVCFAAAGWNLFSVDF